MSHELMFQGGIFRVFFYPTKQFNNGLNPKLYSFVTRDQDNYQILNSDCLKPVNILQFYMEKYRKLMSWNSVPN